MGNLKLETKGGDKMRKNIIKKITVFTAPMLILTLMLGALFT